MPSYRVMFGANVNAESPGEAARILFDHMQTTNFAAFDVYSGDKSWTIKIDKVD